MAMPNSKTNPPPSSIDTKSGFCSETKIYHSLRPHVPLPSLTTPISVAEFAFSLLHSSPPPPTSAALLDAVTRHSISFFDLVLRTKTLASSLRHRLGLQKGDIAFILSPNSLHVPVLYFALFSLGVVISPSNPAGTVPEILHQIRLSKPAVAFATSSTAHKIASLIKTFVLDSPEFESFMTHQIGETESVRVYQSDPAAILYSSGTTGMVKGVLLTHQNFTSTVASGLATRPARETPAVSLCTVPYFHVYGFAYCVRSLAMGETVVSTEKFDMNTMLRTIDAFKVSHVALAPPVVVAMVNKYEAMNGYDLSSLEVVSCGGAPTSKSLIGRFRRRFPGVQLAQAYGLTETTARVFGTIGPEESQVVGATGKLVPNCQAKIVDPDTGIPLPPCSAGELWLRGASIMKGYVGDEEATAATLAPEGWLRTGDLCYIDSEGYLFFVDRIKELIKCKGYQVAPAEIEHLLLSHPEIVEAAVIPYPDEKAGQVPVAFVVRQVGSLIDESQISECIAEQVASYKRIRRVLFIDALPKNAQGKVLRKELVVKLALPSAKCHL